MTFQNHPAVSAMREIRALKTLSKTNPSIAKQNGVEFYGEQKNMITIDTLLSVAQKNSEKEVSLKELEAFMPKLCKFCKLKYDGFFITLL